MRIEIRGVIVPNDEKWIYEWFGFEATAPADVQKLVNQAIEAAGEGETPEDLEVIINSYGGEVYSGSEIYTALKSYPGKVVVKIVGLAASAASIIAMAGDPVMISPTAQIMIHNVQSTARGDHRTHEHEADVLRGHDRGIANAYRLKSGMSEAELLKLMAKETWLNAQEALQHKLVDEIMFDEQAQLAASASPGGAPGLLPREVINKMRNVLVQAKTHGEQSIGAGSEGDGKADDNGRSAALKVRVNVAVDDVIEEIEAVMKRAVESARIEVEGQTGPTKNVDKLASARLNLLRMRGEHIG